MSKIVINFLIGIIVMSCAHAQQVYVDTSLEDYGGTSYDPVVMQGGDTLSGVIVGFYGNGTMRLRKEIENGRANGLWQEWYPNGNLKFSAQWKDGYGHGLWHYFHENGALRQEEFYHMDVPEGIFKEYFNNGELKKEGAYLNGEKHGVWKIYNPDGTLRETKNYSE